MKLKPDASESGIAKDNLVLRCGDCMHFAGTRSLLYEEPCKNRGILRTGVAPNCYTPNIAVFKPNGIPFYESLALLVSNLTPSALRVLTGVLKTSPALAKKGFSLFEKVYFAVGDPKYLSNYFAGYIVSTGVSPDVVLVTGALKKSARMVTASLRVDSILSYEKFVEVRKTLIEKGRLVDPESIRTKFKPKGTKASEYIPPTIDSLNEEPKIAQKLRKLEISEEENNPVRLVVSKKTLAPEHLTRNSKRRRKNAAL